MLIGRLLQLKDARTSENRRAQMGGSIHRTTLLVLPLRASWDWLGS